jgi:serine/threonine-protein kinase
VISIAGPKAGLGPGDAVTVTVSKGPEMIEVPNVVGGLISDGAKTLKALGFNVSSNAPDSYWAQLRVLSMSVSAGSKQPKGSTITLYNP